MAADYATSTAKYFEVGEKITEEEMQNYLLSSKKKTAPGVSGIPIEMWVHGTERTKAELLDLLNQCLESTQVPSQWLYRLIRPLAKTEAAVGLSDIRPITLLEVSQKILTGILTKRIMDVWSEHQVLHPWQMAFLDGKGCVQALERLRGILADCRDSTNKKECHMLFLDLAKAYDSVEYWALEDAMRGIGIPENVLTVMRNLDERAQAKVLLRRNSVAVLSYYC